MYTSAITFFFKKKMRSLTELHSTSKVPIESGATLGMRHLDVLVREYVTNATQCPLPSLPTMLEKDRTRLAE